MRLMRKRKRHPLLGHWANLAQEVKTVQAPTRRTLGTDPEAPVRLGRGGWSWILFEAGMIPQLLLISGFVFVPYFATVVAGGAVEGQSRLAGVQTLVGFGVAFTAPLAGAWLDRWGPRKPWLCACVVLQIVTLSAFWWARPDRHGLPMGGILFFLGAFNALYAYMGLAFNSLLPIAVDRRLTAQASGYGLTAANVVGVTVLTAVLFAFALPGRFHFSGLPLHPLFGLNTKLYEQDRIAGPIAAGIQFCFALPLLFFLKDAPRTGLTVGDSLRKGFNDLVHLMRNARRTHRNLAVFILARMAYGDAVAAYVAFGGVYSAGVMHWGGPQMLAFGILTTLFCGIGAYCGQWLDRVIGPRLALIIEIALLCVFLLAEIGSGPDQILFVRFDRSAYAPLWQAPFFNSWPDLFFLAAALGAAMMLVASTASGRTLLVRLTPPSQMGAVFGFAALTSAATGWLAPLMIRIFTGVWASQQIGFAPLLLLLAVGLIGLLFVRGGDRRLDLDPV